MSEDFTALRYEGPAEGVATIVLDVPATRNAQGRRMTYELNQALDLAAKDDAVKVVILRADGPHFSSGHDLRDESSMDEFETVSNWGGWELPGSEGYMAVEHELYLGMCRRWREFPKPTIAQAHGKTIAGGLMLLWVCDLIVASDDALFADPTVGMGVNGVEWFAHPWELGHRKAKELLFTGDWLSAADAVQLGMVNHAVPADELSAFTLSLAKRIASKPSFALKMAKQSVNQAQDAQGFWSAMQAAFSLQHLTHTHNLVRFGMRVDPSGLAIKPAPATEDGSGGEA